MKTFFCHELDQTLLKSEIHKAEDSYSEFPEIFKESLHKHAPLKSKEFRGNHAPFMKKELSKDFMNKSILRNMYLKWPSRENFLAYKKKKDKCNTLRKKTKKSYFKYFYKNKDFATSKTFWNTVWPFITNKGTISNENIKIKAGENQNNKIKNKNENKLVYVKTNDCTKDEKVLVEMFNNHYISTVEKTSGIVNKILKHYENHPTESKIKCNQNEILNLDFLTAKVYFLNN